MSNKRVLNLTSRKKRDTMLPVARGGSSGTPVVGGINLTPNPPNLTRNNIMLWCPTARDLTTGIGQPKVSIADEATRTSSTCYMRGLKEVIEIQTNSGTAWQWRRICFTMKDPAQIGNSVDYGPYFENSNGFARYLYNVSSGTSVDANVLGLIQNVVFKGEVNSDWTDRMTAPLDTRRISVKSDTTTIIQSGNSSGVLRRYNRWYPMNKNLVYDDDERGGSTTYGNVFSTSSKAGMGDYYILDIIIAGQGAADSDRMLFNPSATLYWHEK